MKKEKSIIVKFYLAFVFILTALAVTVFIYVPGIVKIPVCDVEKDKSEIVRYTGNTGFYSISSSDSLFALF